jgi:hypothetical protein
MILYRIWQSADRHLGPWQASNVDWASWGGLWRTRTGNKSPWGSHMQVAPRCPCLAASHRLR